MEMYGLMLILGLVTGLYLGKIGENRRLRKNQHNPVGNQNWKGGSNQKKRAA